MLPFTHNDCYQVSVITHNNRYQLSVITANGLLPLIGFKSKITYLIFRYIGTKAFLFCLIVSRLALRRETECTFFYPHIRCQMKVGILGIENLGNARPQNDVGVEWKIYRLYHYQE